ncbi:MAG: virulence factor [Gemmatimonadales bacterium]
MAFYQIMYWREIPAHVKAWDAEGQTKESLPERFQHAIDRLAMRQRATSADAYLEGWRWGEEEERPGDSAEVIRAVVADLEAAFPPSRLLGRD